MKTNILLIALLFVVGPIAGFFAGKDVMRKELTAGPLVCEIKTAMPPINMGE